MKMVFNYFLSFSPNILVPFFAQLNNLHTFCGILLFKLGLVVFVCLKTNLTRNLK